MMSFVGHVPHAICNGGNAAMDAIPSGTNECGRAPFNQDQRGNARPFDSNCEMGVYESQDASPTASMSSTAGNPTINSPIPVMDLHGRRTARAVPTATGTLL